jgi:hypothetical protein
VGAKFGELEGDGLTDAASSAGDKRDLVCKRQIRRR